MRQHGQNSLAGCERLGVGRKRVAQVLLPIADFVARIRRSQPRGAVPPAVRNCSARLACWWLVLLSLWPG